MSKQTHLCRTSIRAQRMMGCKAQCRTGAEAEEVGLVPRRGWKTPKIVGVQLMLLLLRPGVHLVGKRLMNLQVHMLQVHGQNCTRMTHDSGNV